MPVVVVFLADGTRADLLPTLGWRFQHREVEQLCAGLNRERDRARQARQIGWAAG